VRNKLKLVVGLASVVFILDHLTKWLIVKYVARGEVVPVISGIFDIVHGRNTGAAFGFLSDWDSVFRNYFFYAIAILAVIFLYHYVKTVEEDDRLSLFSIGFILGGASGNVFDRILRGSVVDFLSIHYNNEIWRIEKFGYHLTVPLTWPAFNVADMAISIAVALLIIQNFRRRKA